MLSRREMLKAIPAIGASSLVTGHQQSATEIGMTAQDLIESGNRVIREVFDREKRIGNATVRLIRAFRNETTIAYSESSDVLRYAFTGSKMVAAKDVGDFFSQCTRIAHVAATTLNNLVENARAMNPGRAIEIIVLNGDAAPQITAVNIIADGRVGSIEYRTMSDVGVNAV